MNGISELISLSVQKFTKGMSGGVIWEGSRLAVDGFQFADGVFVNVINVSTTNLADELLAAFGASGIDLIFGNAGWLIDSKGGDGHVIFGGDDGDVIITGGEDDDVILGGDGAYLAWRHG